MKKELKAIRAMEQFLYSLLRSAPIEKVRITARLVAEHGVDSEEIKIAKLLFDKSLDTVNAIDSELELILQRYGIEQADIADLEDGKYLEEEQK